MNHDARRSLPGYASSGAIAALLILLNGMIPVLDPHVISILGIEYLQLFVPGADRVASPGSIAIGLVGIIGALVGAVIPPLEHRLLVVWLGGLLMAVPVIWGFVARQYHATWIVSIPFLSVLMWMSWNLARGWRRRLRIGRGIP